MKKLEGLQEPLRMFPDDPPLLDGGKEIKINITLSAMLARASSRDPAQAMTLAQRIRDAEDGLVVEEADYNLIVECVQADQMTVNFAKKACLDIVLGAVEVNPD